MQIRGKFPRVIVNTKANGRVAHKLKPGPVEVVREDASSKEIAAEVSLQRWEIQALDLMLGMIPEVREEKVEKLRKKIEAGDYHVDAEEIADKILQFHTIGPGF